MKQFILASLLFLLPAIGVQAGFSGTYRVDGYTPYTDDHKYRGTIRIERERNVYKAHWNYDDGSEERGTGVRQGNQVSFIFQSIGTSTSPGVQVYKILGDNCLEGPWAFLDGSRVGKEKLRRIDVANNSSSSDE